jgi:hypothetical protein
MAETGIEEEVFKTPEKPEKDENRLYLRGYQ